MRRFGESYWQLHRAVVRIDETFDAKTLLSWIEGQRVPRSVASFDILGRIERRYGLPNGYFKAKLPHQSRSLYSHDLEDISPGERRRLAWHLPDDFGSLPFSKREEILEWVRRVIISGSTDYRRFQAAATKQRYAIRLPGITYGGSALTPRLAASSWLRDEDEKGRLTEAFEDPDLLSGVVDAPPRLAMEMADLIRFKTSTLTEVGFRRNGVWNEETASQKIEHLGLMFGALAASPNGVVKGRGVPLNQLTFGLLIFTGVWDWYLQWRERRRGFFTKWEDDMLMVAMAICETYEFTPPDVPVTLPVHVFVADADHLVSWNAARAWESCIGQEVTMHRIEGSHMLAQQAFAHFIGKLGQLWKTDTMQAGAVSAKEA
ncbi:hypothetical protein [Agrobacterium tumefaciens]|uniref:hypothetical protein n=1 Tax=Agrobacterium tumefaciens TaxID=358 RepID=UPI00080FDAF8|nr:hypothetical protein A6U94_24090 [Agrobacterium tumefaciens]